jgi:hypothetical protein
VERYKNYDNKRKNMVEELEARERAFKKARVDKQKEETERWQETEKIKEEGRRLREDKERDMRQREEEQLRMAEEAKEDELEAPSLGTVLAASDKYGVSLTISCNMYRPPGHDYPPQIYTQGASCPHDCRINCEANVVFRSNRHGFHRLVAQVPQEKS